MVKAYEDNFLMSSIPFDECFETICSVSAEDDKAADLTKISGSDDTTDLTDVAPPLEYDLEAELAQALNAEPQEVQSVASESSEPSMEFTGLIEDEFDRALTEQAALLEQEVAADAQEISAELPAVDPEPTAAPAFVTEPADAATAVESPVREPAPVAAEPASEDKNSAFADQLAKLLSEQDTAPLEEVAAPSVVEAELTVPSPEVESAATLSPKLPVFQPETSETVIEVAESSEVAEVSEMARDYSDPAADFQDFGDSAEPTIPAPAPVVPEPFPRSFDAKPMDAVLGASAALGAAAIGASSASADDQDQQLPPAATLGTVPQEPVHIPEPQPEPVFGDVGEPHQEELVIPSADMLGPRVEQSSGGKKVAFVVLALALLGGVGATASSFILDSDADAPVLMADGGAVKVKPKEAGGQVVPNQDQTVYKTVGGKLQKPAQPKLADDTEKPIEIAKVAPHKSESRVSDAQTSEGGATGRLVPRTVRTSVVKPDGTIIVSEPESDKTTVDLARLQPAADTKPKPVKTIAISSSDVSTGTGTDNNTVAATPAKPKDSTMPSGVVEIRASEPKPAAKPVEPVKTAKVETKAPQPVKRVAPTKVKPVKVDKKPVKKEKPKAKVVKQAAASSPYAVQISSQRSPEAAQSAWRKLSKRYASVLSGQTPDIRRVNIEGKGVYYRVRVPSASKKVANSLCSKLKKRGGSCFVTR